MATSIWQPDAPPPSAGAQDDEFRDNSGGLPGGWTESDFAGTSAPIEDAQGLKLTQTSASNQISGIYKAIPAGDFTIWTRVSVGAPAVTNNMHGGIGLWEDATNSTGDIISFVLDTRSTGINIGLERFSQYNAFLSSLISLQQLSPGAGPTSFYLRIRRAGTTYSFDVSRGGVGWVQVYSSTLAFTPTHFGLIVNNNGTGLSGEARFSYFRYVASDVGMAGLAEGDRVFLEASAPTATAAMSLRHLTAAAVGVMEPKAVGAVSLPHLRAAGSGTQNNGVQGMAAAALPGLIVAAAGTITRRGSAAAHLPHLRAAGTANIPTIGTGTIRLPSLRAFGVANVNVGAAQDQPGGGGFVGGAPGEVCPYIDFTVDGFLLLAQPYHVRMVRRQTVIWRTRSGLARGISRGGRRATVQWGEAFADAATVAELRERFATIEHTVRWTDPDGTVVQMNVDRERLTTQWSQAVPGFYQPVLLDLYERADY